MDSSKITQELKERFAAPLPDFYQRRIIFWHDEDREFEPMLDEMDLPGVKIIKLTGSNNFAVKKLLLHDDLTGNYLVYDPISYRRPQDDWLRDVERYSEEYRADYYSLLMNEVNVASKPGMRKTVKLYADFFKNKQRVEKLKKIGRTYETPLQLHIDIMAVLAGLTGNCSAQDVIIAVLSDGLEEENNGALNAIRQFGNIEAFWQLVRRYTGFIYSEEAPLRCLAFHILLSALAQTMNSSVLKGLERFISESNKAYCYSIVYEWRGRDDNSRLLRLCRIAERELKLPARFEKEEIETLLTGDVFPAIHETILKRLFSEVGEQVIKVDLILRTVENRRTAGWGERYANYYDCLYNIAKMQEFYQSYAGGFHIVEPKNILKIYTDKAYEMDSFYRHFLLAFGNTLKDGDPLLEDSLKSAAGTVEGIYKNWFLKELTDCWVNAVSDDLTRLGYVSEILRQRDFFRHYIKPLSNSRTFVVISDALRYEVAVELCGRITRTNRGSAKLEAMQSVFPSVTKFGMAALLPGGELSVNGEMEVLVDGMPTRSTAEREKVLCSADSASAAVRYSDVLNMKRAERRELVSGKNVVYIYHNTIDAIGDKTATEQKVFEACEDTMQELTGLIRIIVNDMQGTDVFITSDHGFLYTYSPLEESEKLSKNTVSGRLYEAGRRYAIAAPDTVSDYLLPVRMDGGISGTPIKGFTPRDTTRISIPGGGENYVHGGISLQEMLVPVIIYKNLRSSSKKYVEVSNAELKLLSESRKVSNLFFSLDFFQRQPIGEKVKPCTYSIYMMDEEDRIISDRQTVIADRASANASERVFRVRLNLKSMAYDKNKIYRLVITNNTDLPQEVEFHIDNSFMDDFGFDL